MRLLIVDGSNIVMRSALGGEIGPDQAVMTATNIIIRCGREYGATHLVVALDCANDETGWRKREYPEYKGHRKTDTSPWLHGAQIAWTRQGWWVEAVQGYEADDVIATIAGRCSMRENLEVMILSGDSDLLPLMDEGVTIIKPIDGGKFKVVSREDVQAKYKIPQPSMLIDLKAMTGEDGDNIIGVEGIGVVRAAALLDRFRTLEGVIESGRSNADKYAAKVYDAKLIVELAKRLITLCRNTPVVPIKPSECVFSP